jgi:hypothetical protein
MFQVIKSTPANIPSPLISLCPHRMKLSTQHVPHREPNGTYSYSHSHTTALVHYSIFRARRLPCQCKKNTYSSRVWHHLNTAIFDLRPCLPEFTSCQPSGWDSVTPESRFSFSPAVCPSGWATWEIGTTTREQDDEIVTTAWCCPRYQLSHHRQTPPQHTTPSDSTKQRLHSVSLQQLPAYKPPASQNPARAKHPSPRRRDLRPSSTSTTHGT